jgi:hypothetical protein
MTDRILEARLTPYELVFGRAEFEDERFPAVLEEAHARGVSTASPDRFLLLAAVGELLRELLPGDGGYGVESGGRSGMVEEDGEYGEVLEHVGLLAYQVFHFWRYGRRLLVLEPALARYLVDDVPRVGDWALTPPYPAGYLQVPRHMFWARASEDAVPEPVDGFFWVMVGDPDPETPPYPRLDVVLVLGVRPGRPGLSTLNVGMDLDVARAGHWGDADARPEGRDFATVLPGGELQGLYSLVTVAEVLKLLSLCFWYMGTRPSALVMTAAGAGAAAGELTGGAGNVDTTESPAVPASVLAYEALLMVGGDG